MLMTQSATGTFEQGMGDSATRSNVCRKGGSWRWSAGEVAAMVAGFVVFWPLGLLALFVKWKNREMWPGSADGQTPWAAWKKPDMGSWRGYRYGFASSGNAAFDEYKRTQLARLEEERRKLDDEQKAFRDHLDRLRKAKDQDEFDRFMAERNAPPETPVN
jgi:Protein of unknown function (DUF2852)